MSENDILAAYEDRLITVAEAIEQADVESIDELYQAVDPEYFLGTIPERYRIRRAA